MLIGSKILCAVRNRPAQKSNTGIAHGSPWYLTPNALRRVRLCAVSSRRRFFLLHRAWHNVQVLGPVDRQHNSQLPQGNASLTYTFLTPSTMTGPSTGLDKRLDALRVLLDIPKELLRAICEDYGHLDVTQKTFGLREIALATLRAPSPASVDDDSALLQSHGLARQVDSGASRTRR